MSSTTEQVRQVQELVRASVRSVDALAPEALRAVMPALVAVREELQRDMTSALGKMGGQFTALRRAEMLRALHGAFERVKDLDPAMARALAVGRKAAGPLAIKNLNTEIKRLSAVFGGGVPHLPDIDTAAVIAQGNKLIWRRHATSARRYSGQVGDDIKHLLAVGVAKHETIEQMVARLRSLGGGSKRTTGLEPGHDASAIAGALFSRHRYWADRLVRSEVMHAYNVEHDVATEHANENRPDGEPEYVRKWDSSADNVTCPICKWLDGKTAPIGGKFPGGYDSPPAHPFCRCVSLAWNPEWGLADGARRDKIVERKKEDPKPDPIKIDDGARKVERKIDDAKPKPIKVAKPKIEAKPKAPKIPKPKKPSEPTFVTALMDASNAGTQAEFHARMSSAVRAELDRSGLYKRERANDQITVGPTSTPGSRAERHWDGKIVLSNQVAEEGKDFVRIFKRDPEAAAKELNEMSPREVSQGSVAGIRTVFHELIHGYGPVSAHKYNGEGAVVEEIATEVLARKHVRAIFGADMRVDTPIGSYGDYIHKATQAVKNATGKGYAESFDALERAAHSFKKTKAGQVGQLGDVSLDFKGHLANAAKVDLDAMVTSWRVAFSP